MIEHLTNLLGRFAFDPDDSADVRIEKSAIALVAGACASAGVVWSLMYVAVFGPGVTAAFPAAFTLIVGGALVHSHRTRNHRWAVYAQILCIMYFTAFIQWSIGGLFDSGFVMAWAFCGPITALVFFRPRGAALWFALFVVNIVVTVAFDEVFAARALDVSPLIRKLFFLMNLSVSSLVVFLFALFFVTQRQKVQRALEAQHEELVTSQQALVRSEKLAALGQLIAGVAHELNTPLGAIRASVENLTHAAERVKHTLPALFAAASDDEIAGLEKLLAAAEVGPLTSREERAIRRSFRTQLEEAGVADANTLATQLANIGVRGDLSPHLPLLTSTRGAALVEAGRDLAALRNNGSNIEIASGRAAKIVFALKSYVHPGSDDEWGAASLRDSVDTVLTLYQNQIKRGVDVVREYADGDDVVPGVHDELNQVWTNLVHNALQAMDGKGTLTIRVRPRAEDVQVVVRDSGPGVSPEALPRLFEPFFTTKPAGEGSGLGLSICRDIVAKHGGRLEVHNEAGAVFTVTLPRARQAAETLKTTVKSGT